MDEQQHRSMVNVVSSTMTWDQSNFRSHSLVIPSVSITSSAQQDATLYHNNSWKEQLATSTHILSEPLSRSHPMNSHDQPLDLTCARKRRSCSDDPDTPLDLSVKKSRLTILQSDLQPIDFANNDMRSAMPPSGNFDNPILVDDAPSTTETLVNWKFPASKLIQFAHLHNSALTHLTPRHLPSNCSSLTSPEQNFHGNIHVNLGEIQQQSCNLFFPEKQRTEVSSSPILHGGSPLHPGKFLEGNQQFFMSNVPSKRIDIKHMRFHEMGSNLRKLLKKDDSVHPGRCSDVFDVCKSQNLTPLHKNNNSTFARNLQIIIPPNYSKATHFEDSTPFPEKSEVKGFLSTPQLNRTSTLSFAAGMENTFTNESSSSRSSCKVLGHRSSKKIPVANVQPFMKAGLLDANEPIVIEPSPPPPAFQIEGQRDSNQSQTKPPHEQTCCFLPQKLTEHQEATEALQSGSMPDDSRIGGPCTSVLMDIREDLPTNKLETDQIPTSNSSMKVSPKEGKLKKAEKKKMSASAIEYIDDDMTIQDIPADAHHKQKRNCFRKSLKRDTESTPPSSTSPSSSSSSYPSEEQQKFSKRKHQQKQQSDDPSNQVLTSSYDKVFQQPESGQHAETSSNQQQHIHDEASQQHESSSSLSSSPSSSSPSSSTSPSSSPLPSSSSSSLPSEGVVKEDNIPGKALNKPMEDLYPSSQSEAATELHPGAQPSCSRFRGSTDRRGRGGKRKNSKKDAEVATSMLRSSQPSFYGFFTSPLRSSNRGRCRKNPQGINTCRAAPSLLMTSQSTVEEGSVTEKNLAETRLHQATRLGCEDLVWHFLSVESIHANVQDNNGTTPLHISSTSGDSNISLMLLSYGAQPNAKALDGSRPLHNAVLGNHLHLVRLFLTYGADPCLANFQGKTPIQLSRTRKMRNFLRGFSNDVNGCGESLWGFSDAMYNHCDSFLSNLPDDDDVEDLHFDVFSSAPLSVYHVQPDRGSRLQACHLLTDVCKVLGTTQKFCSKKLNILESSKFTRESVHAKQSDSSVKFVAIDNQLKKLLKTESFKVQRWIQTGASASLPDKQTSDDSSMEDRKKSKKKQNVVESLSKLAKICKNTSSSMIGKNGNASMHGDASMQHKIKAGAVDAKQKIFYSNNCSEPPPLLVLDKHEAGSSREEETSVGEMKSKSEEMEMPQLTLYS